jgi:CheY-like chemotaxis protein
MLQRIIGEDIKVEMHLDPALPSVEADRTQLEQVLVNLIANARDAMPTGGRLTITTSAVELLTSLHLRGFVVPPGKYAVLTIADTGLGMDESTVERVFEPFFTTKELGKGTGLGLATVYGAVKQAGGYIAVSSRRGFGSTFTIYLPASEKQAAASATALTDSEAAAGTETILLVEDEAEVRATAREALRLYGYTVLEAENGRAALECCRAYHGNIDLVLTDVVMPEMSGRELGERLKAEYPELPVIYMSGYTDDAVIRHGVLRSGSNFIQKPFSPATLTQAVRGALDRAVVTN